MPILLPVIITSTLQLAQAGTSESARPDTYDAPPRVLRRNKRRTQFRIHNERLTPRILASDVWCADVMTLCWNTRRTNPVGSGLRLLLEPRVDFMAQLGTTTDESALKLHVVVGVEMNLAWSWLAVQSAYIAPYPSSISGFSNDSMGGVTNWSVDMNVISGMSTGLSLLGGVLAVGYGRVFYNADQVRALDASSSDFKCGEAECTFDDYGDGFLYVALQPVSAIRSVLATAKTKGDKSL